MNVFDGVPRDGTDVEFFTKKGSFTARWSDTSHHGDYIKTTDGPTMRAGCWVHGSGLMEERVFVSGKGVVGWRINAKEGQADG